MAPAASKQNPPRLTRDDMLRILDLPTKEFREAKAGMTAEELEELRRVWQEESVEAIASSNAYVEKYGLPLAKYRLL